MTAIESATVLVTGGGRGIGKMLVEELYARGADKVYATARDPRAVTHPRAAPLSLEVTDPASVAAAAEQAQDVTILINNAGASVRASHLDSPVENVRREMETNFYGPLLVTRAFVPIIERNGGGHILNVHSARSWPADETAYGASKAALWSQTAGIDAPKADPRDVAVAALDGIEAGAHEVLADDITRWVKSQLSADLEALYAQLKK
ncbi:SDR family NAD(P)-dependent oxidoreductase [Streptomyces spinoverrucosus]|uniref:SDR family NAD(P)-dependent oxidoreductase n=1 Tax=Streptomyces spinoverrucosus TaxID=284043 RepID=UPI0018C3E87C|nr:SDR family NAD(P)-dependent oxidoreductase [Streptomyces spinoverrucosus]MBG0851364.1 SDR family NAD(P)-dependent oxidoreductase [Streptomyces spinoverrucosus]